MAFAVIVLLLALGRLHLALIGSRRERRWHKHVFLAADFAVLAATAATAPLSTGGDVPQIIVFRAYGAYYLVPLVAVAALSLSPGLVLWAGVAATAALWFVFAVAVSRMGRTVSWSDLPPGSSAETYVRHLLDPDFIGTGNRFEESIVLLATAGLIALAVSRARGLVRARAQADRRRLEVQRLFGQYVPEQIAAAVLADPEAVRPRTRVASVLFADIAGFTALAERREPAAVIELLNEFFAAATDAVAARRGVVVSFVGDGFVAGFNAPLANDDHAACAVAAGRDLLALAAGRRFGGEALRLRIGIATGPVAAGSVGGAARQTYTVYGDTVNLAQRLEALNKERGTALLADGATAGAAGGEAPGLRPVGAAQVRGRSRGVELFTLADGG